MFHQLNPQLPVRITSKDNRKGWAIAIEHWSQDDHIHWIVVLDDSGEIWNVPNPEIRVDPNWSFQRRYSK